MEDFYIDNNILEDAYYIVEKYNLDTLRFSYIQSKSEIYPYNIILLESK